MVPLYGPGSIARTTSPCRLCRMSSSCPVYNHSWETVRQPFFRLRSDSVNMKSIVCALAVIAVLFLSGVTARPFAGGWGPEKVKQEAGYITVNGFHKDNGTHIWYWLFESRGDPARDPIMIWLTGGPGCSSSIALFKENGPYILKNGQATLNPYSWNSNATIIFVDQPVGTGFSYADHAYDYVKNEDQIATDMYQFLQQFYAAHPEYKKLDFHIFGESYAGHYVPHLGARIVAENRKPGVQFVIPLKGVAIGNGLVDPSVQYGYYGEILYEHGLLDSVSLATYNDIAYPACEALIATGAWPLAMEECNLAMQGILIDAEIQNRRTINVYNVKIPCEVPPLCYDFSDVDKLMADPSVKKALNVNPKATWSECNYAVHMNLMGDWMTNFATDVPSILASGARVLVYSGDLDFICNYLGGKAWVSQMDWSGKSQYNAAPQKDWTVAGKKAGWSKSYQGLTFLAVHEAGHMVPMDQPQAALAMLETVLTGKQF